MEPKTKKVEISKNKNGTNKNKNVPGYSEVSVIGIPFHGIRFPRGQESQTFTFPNSGQ